MNRHYSEFPEKKITEKAAKGSSTPKGSRPTPKAITEKTAAWPTVGPTRRGGGFNRATKFPVVKTYASKQGVD